MPLRLLLILALTAASATVAWAQRAPTPPYVAGGACPFECCQYGEWAAVDTIPVYAAERDRSRVLFTLAPGERFEAVTGNVHLDRIGVVVVARPLEAYDDDGDVDLAPGDTLHVLDYLGEGFFNVWHDGAVVQAIAEWVSPEDFDPENEWHRGVLHEEPETEWWVEIRTSGGRTGWVWMEEAAVEGADACG